MSFSPFSPESSGSSSYITPAIDVSMDKNDFSDLFDFDNYDSSSSHTHSPKTISPNHTPSPTSGPSPFTFDSNFDLDNFQFDPAGFATLPKQDEPVIVKQEPVEFGFTAPQPEPVNHPTNNFAFDTTQLPFDQQQALQELLANMIKYQAQYGADIPGVATPTTSAAAPSPLASGTIQPAMLFSSAQPVAGPSTISPSVATQNPTPVTTATADESNAMVSDEQEEEPIVAVEEHEQAPARSTRQGSAMSSQYDDLESRIDALVPLPTIFSTGRGKGGKKGGGMSSVVRGDDEDVDDDDSWRPSPEEYKKLSSKEKRQLRNKLSARAFRNRRKDYIGTLESHIKDRDVVIDQIRAELVTSRSENQDLRRELAALKANTMAALHPEQTKVKDEGPQSILAALTGSSSASASAGPSQASRKSVTPQFNPNKDIPSASYGMWGANGPFGNGGSTICHTMLTEDVVLPESPVLKSSTPLLKLPDMPRMNLNPNLNDESPRMPSLSAAANARDLNTSFSDWSESNAFTLRSMDSYRVQMWSRLAREAASEKHNVPADMRPKFFVEPTAAAAAYSTAAQSHISSKLSASFWSAFAGSNSGHLDTDKLAAVVTGKSRLKVVDVEKEKDEAEILAAALGGLKLQSGLGQKEGTCLRARENPLGAIGSFFRCPSSVSARAS